MEKHELVQVGDRWAVIVKGVYKGLVYAVYGGWMYQGSDGRAHAESWRKPFDFKTQAVDALLLLRGVEDAPGGLPLAVIRWAEFASDLPPLCGEVDGEDCSCGGALVGQIEPLVRGHIDPTYVCTECGAVSEHGRLKGYLMDAALVDLLQRLQWGPWDTTGGVR